VVPKIISVRVWEELEKVLGTSVEYTGFSLKQLLEESPLKAFIQLWRSD
jgi:hypothetical protein